MSKDKIEVNMNIHDMPIVIEELEKAQDTIKKLQQENQQLQSNWNSLREWLEEQNKFYEVSTMGYSYGVICNVLDKMNELEGVDNEISSIRT